MVRHPFGVAPSLFRRCEACFVRDAALAPLRQPVCRYTAELETEKGLRMLTIGCHLSSSKGYSAMGKAATSICATTFAFFTRNPRGGAAKAIDPHDAESLMAHVQREGFGKLVAHAPYTLNCCSDKSHAREFARNAMADDLRRMEFTPGNYYNFHPGSHVGQGSQAGIALIAETLNAVLEPQQTTTVLLETMAGKGSEVGRTFEELAAIIDQVELAGHVGVCLDTCHVHDGGYDIVGNLDGVLEEFDRVVGLDRLRAVHINDSKNPCGAHKDRHEVIGEGFIGLDAFARIVRHEALHDLPFILETPNELPGYAREIRLLRALAEGAAPQEALDAASAI